MLEGLSHVIDVEDGDAVDEDERGEGIIPFELFNGLIIGDDHHFAWDHHSCE